MDIRNALLIILHALDAVGASHGSPGDSLAIRRFYRDPVNVDAQVIGRITGIELRKLFSFDEAQFNAQKDSLLIEILNRFQDWLNDHDVDSDAQECAITLEFNTELESIAEDLMDCVESLSPDSFE